VGVYPLPTFLIKAVLQLGARVQPTVGPIPNRWVDHPTAGSSPYRRHQRANPSELNVKSLIFVLLFYVTCDSAYTTESET
jgi:hypothetical protein